MAIVLARLMGPIKRDSIENTLTNGPIFWCRSNWQWYLHFASEPLCWCGWLGALIKSWINGFHSVHFIHFTQKCHSFDIDENLCGSLKPFSVLVNRLFQALINLEQNIANLERSLSVQQFERAEQGRTRRSHHFFPFHLDLTVWASNPCLRSSGGSVASMETTDSQKGLGRRYFITHEKMLKKR